MERTRSDPFGLVALGAVACAGMLLNLSIVPALAQAAGYGEAASYLYWFILDGYAAISMRGSFRAATSKVRSWAITSSVIALVLSAAAAGCHVFIKGGELPQGLAFVVLCVPIAMIGMSLHLVLLMTLEKRPVVEDEPEPAQQVIPARIERQDENESVVTETVTRQVTTSTSRRSSTKSATFIQALKEIDPPESMSVNEVVAKINPSLPDPLHDASARKLVAQWRRGEV